MDGTASDDFLRIRNDDDDVVDEATRIPPPPVAGEAKRIGKTVTITLYPTAANVFYGIQEIALLGDEVEGGAATETNIGDPFLAYHAGAAVVPPSTKVECVFVPHRWVFINK